MPIVKKDGKEVNPLTLNGVPMITSQPVAANDEVVVIHSPSYGKVVHQALRGLVKNVTMVNDNPVHVLPTLREIILTLLAALLICMLILNGIEWWVVQSLVQKGN